MLSVKCCCCFFFFHFCLWFSESLLVVKGSGVLFAQDKRYKTSRGCDSIDPARTESDR